MQNELKLLVGKTTLKMWKLDASLLGCCCKFAAALKQNMLDTGPKSGVLGSIQKLLVGKAFGVAAELK